MGLRPPRLVFDQKYFLTVPISLRFAMQRIRCKDQTGKRRKSELCVGIGERWETEVKSRTLGWETGIEPATSGATVRCSTD